MIAIPFKFRGKITSGLRFTTKNYQMRSFNFVLSVTEMDLTMGYDNYGHSLPPSITF